MEVEKLTEVLTKNPYLINKSNEANGTTLLSRAVYRNNFNITKLLLEKRSNPNLQNMYGETALHQAVENLNHKIINLLLENKANPNIQQKV